MCRYRRKLRKHWDTPCRVARRSPWHSPAQILVDLRKPETGKRITASRSVAQPLKKYARGVAILAERPFGKTADINEPSTIAVKHLALESARTRSRAVPAAASSDSTSATTGESRRYTWRSTGAGAVARAVSPLKSIKLRLNETFDVHRPGRLYRDALVFQVSKKLASRGHVAGHPDAAVAKVLQMRAEVREDRIGSRAWRPFALRKTQHPVDGAPADHAPVFQAVRKIRLSPSIDPQRDPEIRIDILRSNCREARPTIIQVVNKLASMA